MVTLLFCCLSNLLLWEHKITCPVCHSMYSKRLEMTSIEKAITSFQKKLLNDTGHEHKKSSKSILQPCCTLDFSHFEILTPEELLCMCGRVCVGVCENQRNMVSFALIVYFMLLLCVLQSL